MRPMAQIHMRKIVAVCFSIGILIQSPVASAQTEGYREFRQGTYSLEYPAAWSYSTIAGGDGTTFHTFAAAQQGKAIPYCHIATMPLDSVLAPQFKKMNGLQRSEFLAGASGSEFLFSRYGSLASAQGFRLIHSGPGVIGKNTPAFVADFIFKNPQGLFYRVRSHWTFSRIEQLSLWCQVASKNEGLADETFLINLSAFQRFAANVVVPTMK